MKKLKSIDIIDLRIPFKTEFRHHTASRKSTQTVIVKVTDGELTGYGEACPREYVTGESVQSSISFFNENRQAILSQVIDIDTMKMFWTDHVISIAQNPSAWCAIELALLDLFAKQNKCSVEKLLEVTELKGEFRYSAVIGDDSYEDFKRNADDYFKLGCTDLKIKVNGDARRDRERLDYLRTLNSDCTIRMDANNLWEMPGDVVEYVQALPCALTGLEEPLKSKSIKELSELALKLDCPIILDETCCNIESLAQVLKSRVMYIVNIRVSKMGGLINALQIAETCKERGLGVIIGAQVGETSILTRAGLSVANFLNGYQTAMEGAFGTMLLEKDITDRPIMFGQGGKLEVKQILQHGMYGWGLDIVM